MTYLVSWDGPGADEPDRGNEVAVSTVPELDAVLDRIATQAEAEHLCYAAQVHHLGHHGSIMIGIGHPERSFIDWMDRGQPEGRNNRFAVDPALPPVAEDVPFDVYGNWSEVSPERTRVRSATAREAAREYVRTGVRPTGVHWSDRLLEE